MVNNDPIIWTMLNAIKEQQHEIEELKREIRHLRANTTRAGDDDNSITEFAGWLTVGKTWTTPFDY